MSYYEYLISTIVDGSSSKPSLEERLRIALDKVDEFSKTTSEAAKRVDARKAASGLLYFMYNLGEKISNLFSWIVGFSPYLLPATIILQTALWVAYLSDGTASHNLIYSIVEGMDEYSKLTLTILTIFGAAIAFPLVADLTSSSESLQSLSYSPVFDVVVILLLASSILYLFKSYKSVYSLTLAFIGSIMIRTFETDIGELNWLLLWLCIMCLLGAFSALSLPFWKQLFASEKRISTENTVISEEIETNAILSEEVSEPSYLRYAFDGIDWNMDNAPIHPPKRPSRRSEYELYEWVGLLANLLLWPTTLTISMLIGSGFEVDGTPLSMEDNYIMLIGPGAMTAFFFIMQYKMDSSARDGSLYAAQKQAYLDEMEKYVEAKKAYLELVTLQAQIRKEQLLEENPTIQSGTS